MNHNVVIRPNQSPELTVWPRGSPAASTTEQDNMPSYLHAPIVRITFSVNDDEMTVDKHTTTSHAVDTVKCEQVSSRDIQAIVVGIMQCWVLIYLTRVNCVCTVETTTPAATTTSLVVTTTPAAENTTPGRKLSNCWSLLSLRLVWALGSVFIGHWKASLCALSSLCSSFRVPWKSMIWCANPSALNTVKSWCCWIGMGTLCS